MDEKTIAAAAAAVAGLFALAAASGPAFGNSGIEKCWGVAKAGQNDCASGKGGHSCGGQSKIDYDPHAFKWIKMGTCVQIGGSLKRGQPGKLAREKSASERAAPENDSKN